MNGEAAFGSAVKIGHFNSYRLTGQLAGMLEQMSQSNIPNVKPNILFKDKTLAYANDGETLYICTSERLLKLSDRDFCQELALCGARRVVSARSSRESAAAARFFSMSTVLADRGWASSTRRPRNASLAKAIDDIQVATNKDGIRQHQRRHEARRLLPRQAVRSRELLHPSYFGQITNQ